jgi:hypothetical protein
MSATEKTSYNIDRITSLSDLMRLVAQDEAGLAKFVYTDLQLGDVWWIPDSVTGLSKQRHPWVVVRAYASTSASATVCLRTTTFQPRDVAHGIILPEGVLPGLDKPGLIIPGHRRVLPAANFREYEHIGRLPDEWVQRILKFRKS